MICAFLTLLGVVLVAWVLFTWGAMRIAAIAGLSEYPEAPDEIFEDLPPELIRCPRCGHHCDICFRGTPVEPVEMHHCNECGWIGPPLNKD